MKILHIITGLNSGGAETALFKLATFSNKHEHVILSLSKGGIYAEKLKDKNIKVYELDTTAVNFVFTVVKISRIYKFEQPEIVQSWMIHGDFTSSLVKILNPRMRLLWNFRHSDYDIKKTKPQTWLILGFLLIFSKIFPKHIVTCAESIKSSYARWGFPKGKFSVIPNGVDLSHLSGQGKSPKITSRNKTLNLCCVARNHPQKNLKGLCDSVVKINKQGLDVTCTLIGAGTNDFLERYKQELDDQNKIIAESRIYSAGEVVPASALIAEFDILVLPSLFGEGFPNVLIEAMAVGVPCVASDSGDSREIVNDTGWIYRRKNQHQLSSCIRSAFDEIILSPEKYLKKSEAAKETVRAKYSMEHVHRLYMTLYASMI